MRPGSNHHNSASSSENVTTPSPFQSGFESLVHLFEQRMDAVLVSSNSVREGLRSGPSEMWNRIQWSDTASNGLASAAGRVLTGQRVGVILEATRFDGVRQGLVTARERQLGMTVVMSAGWRSSVDLIAKTADIGCPVLVATDVSSMLDLVHVANAVSSRIMMPIVVIAPADRCLWTWGRFPIDNPVFSFKRNATDVYWEELLGQDAERPAWIDPANPMGSGFSVDQELRLKQLAGRHQFLDSQVAGLLDQAMECVEKSTGRPCRAVHVSGKEEGQTVLVCPGAAVCDNSESSSSGPARLHLTRLYPFPTLELKALLQTAQRVGVMLEAKDGAITGHVVVRNIEALLPQAPAPKKGLLHRREESPEPASVTTILHAEERPLTATLFSKLVKNLESSSGKGTLRVLNGRLAPDSFRLPRTEEAIQRLKRQGIDMSERDILVEDTALGRSSVIILSDKPESAWTIMKSVADLLDRAGLTEVRGHLDRSASVAASPALCRVSWRIRPGSDDPGPCVLIRKASLLHLPRIIEHLPVDSQMLCYRDTERALLFKLKANHSKVTFVTPQDSVLPHHLLIAGFAAQHPVLLRAGLAPDSIRAALDDASALLPDLASHSDWLTHATEADFEAPSDNPPEEQSAHILRDAHDAPRPAAQRVLFHQTLGALQESARLHEAPADPLLSSGLVPASSAATNRPSKSQAPLPRVVAERCTGCAACWSICPEAAITVRAFRVEELLAIVMASIKTSFVHLPRLLPALTKTVHSLVAGDELHAYPNVQSLLSEAAVRVLDSAGVDGARREAMEKEINTIILHSGRVRPIRTQDWFDALESVERGSGLLIDLAVDPMACTSCGLCLSVCEDEALDLIVQDDAGQAWHALADLPSFPAEGVVSALPVGTRTLLSGRPSSRVFSPGSEDVGNLNRTALRLWLESQAELSHNVITSVTDQLRAGLKSIDDAMQRRMDESVKINDFEAFSQRLSKADGTESGKLADILGDQQSSAGRGFKGLAEMRVQLSEALSSRADTGEGIPTPNCVLVDTLSSRSTGLAPYPSNPYSMPVVRLPQSSLASSIEGIRSGLIERNAQLGRILRVTKQTIDDTLAPGTGQDTLAEDRVWGENHLPRLLIVTDAIDASIIELLGKNFPVQILILSGGPDPEVDRDVVDPFRLSFLFPNIRVTRRVMDDAATLLDAVLRPSSEGHPAVSHVLQVIAPDPSRDGVAVEDVIELARMAGRTRHLAPFDVRPGEKPEFQPRTGDQPVTLAEWMQRQLRFNRYFTPVPKNEWSSDQVPVADWLQMTTDERSRVIACVFRQEGSRQTRFLPDAQLLDLIIRTNHHPDEASSAAQQTSEHIAVDPTTKPSSAPAVSDDDTASDATVSSPQVDAFSQLTDNLLQRSGFGAGGPSLKAWLEERLKETEQEG